LPRIFCWQELPSVHAAKRATDFRCYPDPTKFPLRGYFFFFFADFFFAFFAFLAMLPSVIPKSSLDASRESTCICLDYTTIAKLILLASNRVNGHQIALTCERTKLRVLHGPSAPCQIEMVRSSRLAVGADARFAVMRSRNATTATGSHSPCPNSDPRRGNVESCLLALPVLAGRNTPAWLFEL
jgi:hypothetical protein